ncbi:MAG: hypothetical protein HQK87_02855 [Nitrospinae bacterium]|nr:hypothetical protein [Nitrospinota bacterium]
MPNIIVGLVMVALGIWGLSVWWWSVAELLRGLAPIVLILVGLVAVGAGISLIRERGDDDLSDEDIENKR